MRGAPQTSAGKRLAGRLAVIYPADHQRPLLDRDIADIVAAEDEAALAARSEPRCSECMDPPHGNETCRVYEFDRMCGCTGPRSEPGAEGLDVERLARAVERWWHTPDNLGARDASEWIAREYAALAETEPKP